MPYQPNTGTLPEACAITDENGNVTGWRNVHVQLFGGYDSKKAGAAPWPAKGGRPHDTRWAISEPPHRFQIEEYELA